MKIVNENNNTILSEAQKQGEKPYMPVEEFNLLYRYFQALISKLDDKEYAAHFRRPDQMREYAKGFCDNFHTLLRKIKHEDDLGKTGSLLSYFDYGAFKNPKKLSNMLAKVRDKGENRLSKALNHNSELASMVHKLGNNYIGAVLTCMDELQSKKAVKAALQNESLEEELDNVEVTDNTVVVPQPMAVAKEESEDLWKKFLDATEEPKDAPLFGAEDQPTPDEVEEPKAELEESLLMEGIDVNSFRNSRSVINITGIDWKPYNGNIPEGLPTEITIKMSDLADIIYDCVEDEKYNTDFVAVLVKAVEYYVEDNYGAAPIWDDDNIDDIVEKIKISITESLSSKLTLDESLFEDKKTLKEGVKEEKAALREVQKQLRRLLIEIKDNQKSISSYAKGNGNYTNLIDDLYEARNGLLGAIDDIDNLIFEDHQLSSRRNESLKLKEGYSVVDLETGDRFGNYDDIEMAKNKAYRYATMFKAECAVINDRMRPVCGFRSNGREISLKGLGESFKKKLKEANGADGQLFNGQKDIADSFKNYKAFKANFKPVHIVKVNGNYFVFNEDAQDSNSYIYYSNSKDNIEGWLYGAVQAKNKRIAEGLKKNKKSVKENFYLKTKNTKKKLNEAYITKDFDEFEPWSGAVEVWNRILDEDKLDDLERFVDEVYEGVIGETELNDLLRFDSDYVYDVLGMSAEEDVDESLKKGKKRNLKEEVSDYAYTIAQRIDDEFRGQGYISWEDFNEAFENAFSYEEASEDPELSDYFSDESADLWELETDVRGVLSMMGWETIFEGEDEGSLKLLESKKSVNKKNLKESDDVSEIKVGDEVTFYAKGYKSNGKFGKMLMTSKVLGINSDGKSFRCSDPQGEKSFDYVGKDEIISVNGKKRNLKEASSDKKVEAARKTKEKLAKKYDVSETSIVWLGGNNFVVVKDGKEIRVNADEILKEASTLPKGGKDEDFDTDAWSVIYWELSANSEDSTSTRNMKKLAKTSAKASDKYERVDPVNDSDLRVYAKDEDGFKLAKKVADAWKVKYEIEPTKKSHQAKFPDERLQMTIFIPEEMLG